MPRTLLLAVLMLGVPAVAEDEDAKAANERHLAELRKVIAGREEKKASEVFENLKGLGDMPAGRLLKVMEIGYARSLGVACTHCHVAGQWAADEKKPKRVAREMRAMMRRINEDLLAKVPGLQSEKPVVNCTTCHRGQVKPALDLK
jgi:hypothetical protein